MTEQRVTPTAVFDNSDVVFTVSNAKGEDEGDEFISSLQTRDQTKFQRYLEYLRDGHHIKSPENMRQINGVKDPMGRGAEVHELKTHRQGGLRLYVVRFQDRWYITHGDRKGGDRQVVKNAKKAFAIFWGGDIEGESNGTVSDS